MAKHGHTGKDGWRTPTYNTWAGMIARCHNPTAHAYDRYGGRGVIVCARWRGPDGFVNFLADMGERPPGTSLDRINNDGNYTHLNCRWATAREQCSNRRTAKLEPHEFEQICWLVSLGIRRREVASFFGVGEPNIGYVVRSRRRAA